MIHFHPYNRIEVLLQEITNTTAPKRITEKTTHRPPIQIDVTGAAISKEQN
jgi:hypothetical protein